MPKSEEIQKEWELEEKIKEDEIKTIIAKQRALKTEHRNVKREESEQNRIENTKDLDGKFLWDKVREDAEQMIRQGPAGYNDWAVGMSNLISHFLLLNKATIYDPIFPFRDEIVGVKNMIFDFVWDMTLAKASDKIDQFTFPDRKLPKLEMTATINEQGSMIIKATRDGQDLTKDADEQTQALSQALYHKLRTGVAAWAKTQGYNFKENPDEPGEVAFYTDPGDEKMTKEKFKELNDNREEALDTFLSGRFDMPLTCSMSP